MVSDLCFAFCYIDLSLLCFSSATNERYVDDTEEPNFESFEKLFNMRPLRNGRQVFILGEQRRKRWTSHERGFSEPPHTL